MFNFLENIAELIKVQANMSEIHNFGIHCLERVDELQRVDLNDVPMWPSGVITTETSYNSDQNASATASSGLFDTGWSSMLNLTQSLCEAVKSAKVPSPQDKPVSSCDATLEAVCWYSRLEGPDSCVECSKATSAPCQRDNSTFTGSFATFLEPFPNGCDRTEPEPSGSWDEPVHNRTQEYSCGCVMDACDTYCEETTFHCVRGPTSVRVGNEPVCQDVYVKETFMAAPTHLECKCEPPGPSSKSLVQGAKCSEQAISAWSVLHHRTQPLCIRSFRL
eukprot:SAG31_NODE_4808_length_2945_cov_2.155306_4_plen_277_part_00